MVWSSQRRRSFMARRAWATKFDMDVTVVTPFVPGGNGCSQ